MIWSQDAVISSQLRGKTPVRPQFGYADEESESELGRLVERSCVIKPRDKCKEDYEMLLQAARSPVEDEDLDLEQKAQSSSCKAYEDACAALRVLPTPAVVDQLARSRFELSFYGLAPLASRALAAGLRANTMVTILDLPDNSLGSAGVEAIANAISHHKTITRLNIARNRVTTEQGAVTALVELLTGNRVLSALNVAGNAFGDRGVKQILDAALVAAGYSLAELDVGDTGAAAMSVPPLASLVRNGTMLRRVGLSGLLLPTGAWVEQILPAMSKAKALHCADLSHNNIGDGAVWKLEEVIKAQACLQVLDLCDVRFTPAVAQALETVIGAVGPDMHMVIVDVQMGRALLKAGRARRRLAKASGETKPPRPKIALRPGSTSETGSRRLNVDLVSSEDVLRPASRLIRGDVAHARPGPPSRYRRYYTPEAVPEHSQHNAHNAGMPSYLGGHHGARQVVAVNPSLQNLVEVHRQEAVANAAAAMAHAARVSMARSRGSMRLLGVQAGADGAVPAAGEGGGDAGGDGAGSAMPAAEVPPGSRPGSTARPPSNAARPPSNGARPPSNGARLSSNAARPPSNAARPPSNRPGSIGEGRGNENPRTSPRQAPDATAAEEQGGRRRARTSVVFIPQGSGAGSPGAVPSVGVVGDHGAPHGALPHHTGGILTHPHQHEYTHTHPAATHQGEGEGGEAAMVPAGSPRHSVAQVSHGRGFPRLSIRQVAMEYSVRASMSSQKWNRYHVPAAPGEEERRKPPTLARMPWENANWERTIQREMVELAAAAKAASTLRADTAKELAESQSVWGPTREMALTDDLVQARRDLNAEPLSPSRLQAVALAAAALRDYHATAVAALQAMMKEQEDPVLAFREAVGALRIRRLRLFPEAKRNFSRRNGWGIYSGESQDSATDEEGAMADAVKPPRRRHMKYGPSAAFPDPEPEALLCSGFEDILRRLADLFAQGPNSAEWERYRAREYLRDAQADLRVVYDWYRSLPGPGESADSVDEYIGLCTEPHHCRLSSVDDYTVAYQCSPLYSTCTCCSQFGKLGMHAVWRHMEDAGMVNNALSICAYNRCAVDALKVPEQLMPPINPDDLPEDDTTVQVGPREQATAELAEHEAAEQSHGAMHLGSFRLGFYEWVEFLVRCAWVSNNGRRDGVAWAFDRMLWTTVPDDVAIAMLPRECYGPLGPDPDEANEADVTDGSKPPPKQPVSWEFLLVRAGTVPPIVDSRDAFRKRFQGPGRKDFMSRHRVRLFRSFLFFSHDTPSMIDQVMETKPGDCVCTFNSILRMFTRLRMFSPDITPMRLRTQAAIVTGNDEVISQEHPINQKVEFTLEQFIELMARVVPQGKAEALKSYQGLNLNWLRGEAAKMWLSLALYLDTAMYPEVQKIWHGKWREY